MRIYVTATTSYSATLRRMSRTVVALFIQAVRRDLQFRSQVWIGSLTGLGELMAGLVPVLVITSFYPRGSPVSELVAPTAGFFAISCGLMDTFITPGLRRFDTAVRKGNLDTSLLRPVPTPFYVILRWMRPAELIKSAAGGTLLIVWASTSYPPPSLAELLIGLSISFIGVLAYSAAWTSAAFLALWLVSIDPVNDLAAIWRNSGQYPLGIFTQGLTILLQTAIPVVALAALPAAGAFSLGTMAMLALAALAWIAVAILIWNAGIRRYEGAST